MITQFIEKSVNTDTSTAALPRTLPGSAFSAAFQRRLAEIQAVPEELLAAQNLDLSTAITTVRGALPGILEHQEGMAKLVGLDQRLLDGLEDYALAAAEANAIYDVAIAPREDIVSLNDEALALRERLRDDTQVLAKRGLIDKGRLAQFTGAIGYRNVAFELLDYVTLLWDVWPAIEGKTAVTVEELQHAKQFAEHLTLVVGLREQAPAVAAEAAKVRHQALTLLVRSYDETRRGLWFLRWREGDVDSIAPSLYASRSRKRAGPEEPVPPPTATGAPAPVPAPTAATAAPQEHVAPGMPGGSPFMS